MRRFPFILHPFAFILLLTATLLGCAWRERPVALALRPRTSGLAATSLEAAAALPDAEFDLATAALLLDREEDPRIDLEALRARLDREAARLRRLWGGRGRPRGCLEVLAREVLKDAREVPARDAPSPPGFSLARVLAEGRGDCLGFSLYGLALAERAGLPLEGVAVPGHLFVRLRDRASARNAELTAPGVSLPDRAYRAWRRIPETPAGLRPLYLRGLSGREVLALLVANRAGALASAGRGPEALREADRAIRFARAALGPTAPELPPSPAVPVALTNRALARERLGDRPGAVADYQAAVCLDPCAAPARRNLALLLAFPETPPPSEDAKAQSLRRALALAREAVRLRPAEPEYERAAARIARATGQEREAAARDARASRLEARQAP